MTDDTKHAATRPEPQQPPRQTYMPKPPSEEEVEQVSREQAMVTDDWTGEPSASEGGKAERDAGAAKGGPPPGAGGGG
jgi:hypothetical protein